MVRAQSSKPEHERRPVATHTSAGPTHKAAETASPAHETAPETHPATSRESTVEPKQSADRELEQPDEETPRETMGSGAATASGEGNTTRSNVRNGNSPRPPGRNGSSSGTSDDPRTTAMPWRGDGVSSGISHGPRGVRSTGDGYVSASTSSSLVSRPMDQDSAEAQAVLHRVNVQRSRLSGVNNMPIPEGRVFNSSHGVTVSTGDGRSFSLRADGTLARFQSRIPGPAPNRGDGPSGTIHAPHTPMAIGPPSTSATFGREGRITSLHTGGFDGNDIRHGAHGERVIVAHLQDQSTLVSTGRQSGYLERAFDQDGRVLVQRTYVSGNKIWQRNYEGSSKMPSTAAVAHGTTTNGAMRFRVVYKQYLPRYSYPPGFYRWVNQGWASPINYKWNWTTRRWYIYFGSYFYPWTSYSDGSYWLTDYILGQTLADGYDMQPDGGGAAANNTANAGRGDSGQQADDETVGAQFSTAISSEVKQEIASEVHQQLTAESGTDASATYVQAPVPDDPDQFMQVGHVFVVSSPINARLDENPNPAVAFGFQQCNLSPGDVIRLKSIPQNHGPNTAVVSSLVDSSASFPLQGSLEVVASLKSDCPLGVQVILSSAMLQEMENNFQAQMDDGLHVLYGQQGKDGVPAVPASTVAQQTAATDNSVDTTELGAQLLRLQAQANQAEAQITQTMMSVQAVQSQP